MLCISLPNLLRTYLHDSVNGSIPASISKLVYLNSISMYNMSIEVGEV